MSIFSGRQAKGAMKAHRLKKRADAEERDAALGMHSPKRRQVRLVAQRLDNNGKSS